MGTQKIVKLTSVEDIYASNILTNVSSFNSGLTSGDTTVQLALNDVDTKIGMLNSNVSGLTTTASVNASNISGNTASITSLNSTVTGHTTQINANTTSISGLTASINSLNSSVSGNTSSINVLNSSVSGLTTSVNTNTINISGNTASINTINNTLSTLSGSTKLNVIQFEVDGSGFPLTSGIKTPYIYVAFDCTIVGWDLLCSASDTFSVDILYNSTFSNSPTSITTGGTAPNVLATAFNSSSSVAGWANTTLSKGGIITLNITGTPTSATWLALKLRVQ